MIEFHKRSLMAKLQINAGQDHIAKYVVANPIITGITELIWNSLDANATLINIITKDNGLNGFEYIDIIDNGHIKDYLIFAFTLGIRQIIIAVNKMDKTTDSKCSENIFIKIKL